MRRRGKRGHASRSASTSPASMTFATPERPRGTCSESQGGTRWWGTSTTRVCKDLLKRRCSEVAPRGPLPVRCVPFPPKTVQDSDWRPTCPCGLLALTLRTAVYLRDPWKNHRRMAARCVKLVTVVSCDHRSRVKEPTFRLKQRRSVWMVVHVFDADSRVRLSLGKKKKNRSGSTR